MCVCVCDVLSHRLRIRVKGLQQVIDSQGTKIASLLTEREMTALGHADENTGQGTSLHGHVTCHVTMSCDMSCDLPCDHVM